MLDKKIFDIPSGSVFISNAEIDSDSFGPQEFAKGIALLQEEKQIVISMKELSAGLYLKWRRVNAAPLPEENDVVEFETPEDSAVISVEEPPC